MIFITNSSLIFEIKYKLLKICFRRLQIPLFTKVSALNLDQIRTTTKLLMKRLCRERQHGNWRFLCHFSKSSLPSEYQWWYSMWTNCQSEVGFQFTLFFYYRFSASADGIYCLTLISIYIYEKYWKSGLRTCLLNGNTNFRFRQLFV